jgi:hypothetical protein
MFNEENPSKRVSLYNETEELTRTQFDFSTNTGFVDTTME